LYGKYFNFDNAENFNMSVTVQKMRVPDFRLSPRIDQAGVEERAARFTKRSIKKETKLNGLKLVLNMIDLTTLEGKDTEGKVKQLCYKAVHLHDAYPGLPTVAAVCVYPTW
jgi:deoxyribose-phosphate aldolase